VTALGNDPCDFGGNPPRSMVPWSPPYSTLDYSTELAQNWGKLQKTLVRRAE